MVRFVCIFCGMMVGIPAFCWCAVQAAIWSADHIGAAVIIMLTVASALVAWALTWGDDDKLNDNISGGR